MGLSNGRLERNSSDCKFKNLTKFARLMNRDKSVSFWFKDVGKDQFYEIVTAMNEMIEKKEYCKDKIFNLHRFANPSTEHCERFIHLYKKVFGNSEHCNLFFGHFKASVAANYDTPWSKFCKTVVTQPLLWEKFQRLNRKKLMSMCIKMELLREGMVSEREMKQLAVKHYGFQITEHEFKDF